MGSLETVRHRTSATASDGLLFETGVYRFAGSPLLTVSFLRQFEVLYEPIDELRALGSFTLWCFPSDGDSVSEWYGEVEGSIEFEWAARLDPWRAAVDLVVV